MGIISSWVDTAQGQLDGVAESTFGDLVAAGGATISAMATLAIILLGINLVLQYRPMSAGYILMTIIKLVAIVWIGLKWDQFNSIAESIRDGMDAIAATMLQGIAGGESLAVAIDGTISEVSKATNAALEPLGPVQEALTGTAVYIIITIIGGLVALALIFVSVVLTLYLGIAPIFIALSMFDITRDYFARWVQGTTTYLIYPIVLAGVLGAMVRIVKAYMDTLSTADAGESIAGFIPFLSTLLIMIFIIILIPKIVSGLTGMMQFSGPLAPVLRTMQTLAAANTGLGTAIKAITGGGGDKNKGGNNKGSNGGGGGGKARSTAANVSQNNAKYDK